MKLDAGCLIYCESTGRILLLQDNPSKSYGSVWSLVSGEIEENESAFNAVKREVGEEVGIDPEIIDYYFVDREDGEKNVFSFFVGVVEEEFEPQLSWEHVNYGWFNKDELPENLYPGLDEKIEDL